MPMPKVGDWVVITLSGPSDQRLCQVRSVDGDAFLCGCEGNATRFERTISSPLAGRKSWCFADPAVEAQRLQEAAWRADTSPFPWWIKQALLFCEDEGVDKTIEQLTRSAIELNCENMEQSAKFMLENGHHLLRWQAQQEGGDNA